MHAAPRPTQTVHRVSASPPEQTETSQASFCFEKKYAHLEVEELLGHRLLELIGLLALRLDDLGSASEHGAWRKEE